MYARCRQSLGSSCVEHHSPDLDGSLLPLEGHEDADGQICGEVRLCDLKNDDAINGAILVGALHANLLLQGAVHLPWPDLSSAPGTSAPLLHAPGGQASPVHMTCF